MGTVKNSIASSIASSIVSSIVSGRIDVKPSVLFCPELVREVEIPEFSTKTAEAYVTGGLLRVLL